MRRRGALNVCACCSGTVCFRHGEPNLASTVLHIKMRWMAFGGRLGLGVLSAKGKATSRCERRQRNLRMRSSAWRARTSDAIFARCFLITSFSTLHWVVRFVDGRSGAQPSTQRHGLVETVSPGNRIVRRPEDQTGLPAWPPHAKAAGRADITVLGVDGEHMAQHCVMVVVALTCQVGEEALFIYGGPAQSSSASVPRSS